jgi:casein kinase II subunit beta
LTDRFNLTGLNQDVQYYQYALELITDILDVDCDDEMREQIEKSARHLYGLIHARFIITTRGLSKMVCPRKALKGDYFECANHIPRWTSTKKENLANVRV